MKTLILALLLFTLLPVPPVQEDALKERTKTFRNSKRFSVKYDRFRDDTMLSVGPFFVGGTKTYIGSGRRLEMSAYIFLDRGPLREAYLRFDSHGRDWTFLKDSEFLVLVDGERKTLGEGDRDSDVRLGGVSESMVYVVPIDDFIKIGRANQVEFKIGRIELTLKDEHKEAFRDLLSLAK